MIVTDVFINLPAPQFNHTFRYLAPGNLSAKIRFGQRVQVELGRRILEAYVVGVELITDAKYKMPGEFKPVIEILDENPVFTRQQLDLACWMADFYLCTIPLALKTIIPSSFNKKGPTLITALFKKEELDEIIRQNPGSEALLRSAASRGGLEMEMALKITSQEEINKLKERKLIGLVRKYSSYRKNSGDYIYKPLIFDAAAVLKLAKSAPRQGEALEYLISSGSADKTIFNKLFPASSIKGLLQKGFIKIEIKKALLEENAKILTDEQEKALQEIRLRSAAGSFSEMLLFGITGSGKTEIYLRAAQEVIKTGRRVLMLAPEIVLTNHLVEMAARRFERMAVIHSQVPAAERFEQYQRINSGEIDFVLGTRSAVLAPLENIGLIIVDEEQENSYKQETTPRYHAREVARKRAEMDGAVLVLGTATPAIETFYAAITGKTGLLHLEKRVGQARLPEIIIADQRKDYNNNSREAISNLLQEKLSRNLAAGEQSIILINRRGYSPVTICRQCGNISTCKSCSVAMTYHQDRHKEVCHYCGFENDITESCMKCGSKHIQRFGFGTQKVEEEIKSLFPQAAIARLDLDVSIKSGRQKEILIKMESQQIDILVGTQMVAKGFNFFDVSLVGIIDIDNMLGLPDYRAAERSFQLLVQAAGRAGRGKLSGEVIIQTYNADNPVIKYAVRQDYFNFYTYEIKNRKLLEYPPFKELLRIVVSSAVEDAAAADAALLKTIIEELVDAREEDIEVLGPAPSPRYRIKGLYRYQLLIKADEFWFLNSIGRQILASRHEFKSKLDVELNPVSMI